MLCVLVVNQSNERTPSSFLLRQMPEEALEQCTWIVPKLVSALAESKILPVRLSHLKHQEVLRSLAGFVVYVDVVVM